MIWEACQEWAKCREAMLPAIAETDGTHSEDDILAMICAGKLRLWTNGTSGVVTEIIQYPQKRVLNWFLVGGDLIREVAPLIPQIEAFAREKGCNRVQGLATLGKNGEDRGPGWTKLTGASAHGTFLYKDL